MKATRSLVLGALLLAGCDDGGTEASSATPAAPAPEDPPKAAAVDQGTPEPEASERPDEPACTEFVHHAEVMVAQSLGVPADNLFTDGERRRAIEHCQRFAHDNVLRCARDTQVMAMLNSCLFFTALPRPEVDKPEREQCERYAEHVRTITDTLQQRTVGMASLPPSPRQVDLNLQGCMNDFTANEVTCGLQADSQLALVSCFSPYQASEPHWPTAEECEVYGDHMMSVLGTYLLAPFPKPAAATLAIQQSGLGPYAVPQVQRFQLVNLCHQLDRDLVECHTKAKTAADLGQCLP